MSRHPRRVTVRLATTVAVALLFAAPAGAQTSDPADAGVLKFGPITIRPTFMVRNVGRDNNVFNETVNPKKDFTMTLSPAAELVFQPRRLKVTYTQATDYVYFRTYKEERGANQSSSLRADLDLGVLQPYIGTGGINTKARLNHEIDERARHNDRSYIAGVTLKLFTSTSVRVGVRQLTTRFEDGEEFRGQRLADTLNSRLESVEGTLGIALTPLTSVGVQVAKERQVFDLARERDSDTLRVMPTLTFSPLGLINGSVALGYRKFTARDPATPAYSGFVAAVGTGVTLFDNHHVNVSLIRDLNYSYDRETPYFVGTSATLTWTYAVAGPFDIKLSATRDRMHYRGAGVLAGADEDNYDEYGAGLGYRFRRRLRIGVQGDYVRRDSDKASERNYDNNRIYGTLTWGT
jgi:hypothetical protein